MNRTVFVAGALLVAVAGLVSAQDPPKPPEQSPPPSAIDRLVETLRAAESAAKTVLLEMRTEGRYPGGATFETRGSLRVLRGTQPAVHSVVEFTFADGLSGRIESVKRPDGVWMLERNPTFGEVYLHLDAELVADLEWAGEVLAREDLPGMADSRAAAPLGSALVGDLARQYDLRELDRKDRDGQEGRWFGGDLRSGVLPEGDPDLPMADRVELFVRNPDQALLEVVHLKAGKALQRIAVQRLQVDAPMTLESFRIDPKGAKLREVRDFPPAWEQIQQLLKQAEDKVGDKDKRPSKRG